MDRFASTLREIQALPDTDGEIPSRSRQQRNDHIEHLYTMRDTLDRALANVSVSLDQVHEEIKRLVAEESAELTGLQGSSLKRRISDSLKGDKR